MKGLLPLLISSMILPAHAGIVIYGTRIIYPAENKEVMVQLMNQGNRSSLLQAWIDDGDTSLPPEKIQVPFMLTPPVAKVGANSGQQIKIRIMPNRLPTNKESIFYLNILDIPPNSPEDEGKNALKFAMQNRIKLFYRPVGVASVNKETFKKLRVNNSSNGLVIKNGSANWVTISDVKANSVKVNYETIMIAPQESQRVDVKNHNANSWQLTIIDDHGNYISEKL
ncbi:fimbria/pilus periplasmic chaperone [Escherichia albertii]|uniref:fimbria/pilus periplasmic chaperone n=1 Tax=Escherichia albertii TaxID=208962 RepID=UPI0007436F1D|nr:fimbria/pilus periplasmic chaperone [Escherichia albertii]MCE7713355.1 fimbria/pilus periplasmic chaperone [Escherichia albertii]MCQ8912121.1 fimbria/pilus periplasmic chaperone [Escherichia albertii]MCQ8920242.1 fimbria/pilus periplasmic chaperone [Escherichia albertii]MCQ8938282.1 fimbria/pilus periplasmic chaperone [Escherichia albertii]MCQ8951991.1 fimbria/pilus periplasmic chaperone [Escherichia albertii]